ncbi:MAG: serine protease [Planctomycetaceae bacterium]|nr:serine protease [Planctomycetaceae bacterium]
MRRLQIGTICLMTMLSASTVFAQSVCLPLPRLLTMTPMGGQAGTNVDVTISGDNIEDVELLRFSHPGLTAIPKLDANGLPIPNQFVVTIADDCPVGIHEARVLTRLGISSSRVFNVGSLPESSANTKNTSLESAVTLALNSICNASVTRQAVDHFSFQAEQGQRILVDCAAQGIDSKLKPVVILANEQGQDLVVERRGGVLDFTTPEAGTYVIKVHDLTFNGGPEYFYRLAVTTAAPDAPIVRMASTRDVNMCSWPPVGLTDDQTQPESEPNNEHSAAQKITLPCDLSGSFFPAADVDLFEFEAKKGEVWWVEVASERLGRPTDPSVVVQHVATVDGQEKRTDVVELTDIASPVKVSSTHYAYDGPPYNAGSTDVLGKLEIKADGLHRLQLHDAFGGTRNDPRNVYRLIVRKAEPDFALVAWRLHMELRNGDRNALSKPLSLRGGSTVALEVVAIRRDGFDGPISLHLENLPEGVTATGLTIPPGQSRGIMLVTSREDAPRGLTSANFIGRAEIDGQSVERPCHLASMAWPVPDHWREIPSPRLVADVPVCANGNELAPLTIAAEDKVWEAVEGEKLTIPLNHTPRCEFSGTQMTLKTFGQGFEGNPSFSVEISGKDSKAELDLAKLKVKPGDYTIAFYGSAVAKYRYNPDAVSVAEASVNQAKEKVTRLTEETKTLAESAKTATEPDKADVEARAKAAEAELKAAQAALAEAEKSLKEATAKAQPKDLVDIVATPPIQVRVAPKPAE